MDLGLDFDDSDFVQPDKPKPLLTSYNAKICGPQWFLDEKADNKQNDKATLYKFRGDYFYRLMNYQQAVECYNISLGNLGSQNRTMRREVTESLARCHMNLGHTELAIKLSDQVMADCLTKDQTWQCLMLKQHIYQRAGLIRDELKVLYRLIHIHPRNVEFWTSLKQAYKTIQTMQEKPDQKRNNTLPQESNTISPLVLKDTGTSSDSKHCGGNKTNVTVETKSKLSQGIKDTFNNSLAEINGETLTEKINQVTNHSERSKNGPSNASRTETFDSMEQNFTNLTIQTENGKPCDKVTDKQTMKPVQSPCSTENDSNSIGTTTSYDDILTELPCHLLVLTCCVRLRLILQTVQGTVGSFIKEKNLDLQNQITTEISSLDVSETILQNVTEAMKRDMFEDDYGENSSSENEDKEIPALTPVEFNKRWFSWIRDT